MDEPGGHSEEPFQQLLRFAIGSTLLGGGGDSNAERTTVHSGNFCPRGTRYDEDGEDDAIGAVHEEEFWWCHPVSWVFVLLFRRILGYSGSQLVP